MTYRLALSALVSMCTTTALATQPNGNVRAISATAFEFDREEILTQIAAERRHSCQWVVPHYVGDRYAGVRIVGVRPDSVFSALGLRPKDIIQGVSGVAIDSPNRALLIWDAMADETNFSVTIERAGKPITLEYRAN